MRIYQRGSTSTILTLQVPYGIGGATGITASLVVGASYKREGDTSVTPIAVVANTAGGVGVWQAGAWQEVDPVNAPGMYEFGIPDAVMASATARLAYVYITPPAPYAMLTLELNVTAVNLNDAANFGLSTLAKFAFDGAGNVFSSINGYVASVALAMTNYVIGAAVVTASGGSQRSLRNALNVMLYVLAGKSSNGGATFYDENGNAVVTAMLDGSGNRTATSVTPTA